MTVVKFDSTGELLFIADKDSKYISLVSTFNNQIVGTYNGHNGVVWHLDITQDSQYMISCSGDMSCIIWDVKTGNILNRISETGIPKYVSIKDDIVVITCDPISKRSKSYISVYSLTELITGTTNQLHKLIETKSIRATTVNCIIDDIILATYDDGVVKKINYTTNNIIQENKIHTDSIKSVYFSNDKTNFVTASLDCSSKIIDLETLTDICVFKSSVPVNISMYTPDNKYVILGGGIEAMMVAKTSDNDLTTKVYQVSNQKLIKQISNHFGPLRYLDFNLNNSSFVTASQDGLAKIHYFDVITEKDNNLELFGLGLERELSELCLINEKIQLNKMSEKEEIEYIKGNKKTQLVQQKYPVGHQLYKVDEIISDYMVSAKSYKSNEPKNTSAIKVFNLPEDVDISDLWEMFEYYGRIENNGIRVKKLYNDTIAFVNYMNIESAVKAIDKCNKKKLGFCIIGVEMAKYN